MAGRESVQSIARDLYAYLARRFPVCCSSDEFCYFPQALTTGESWSVWDDLNPESLADAVEKLKSARGKLSTLLEREDARSTAERINASLVCWVTEALEEQIEGLRPHVLQPTFILTVATIGLVQAMQSGPPEALRNRMRTLPAFLGGFGRERAPIPSLYREMGMEMAGRFMEWVRSVSSGVDSLEAAKAAEELAGRLRRVRVLEDFRPQPELLERIVHHHTGSRLSLRECLLELETEAREAAGLLHSESLGLGYDGGWQAAWEGIGMDRVPRGNKVGLLLEEIERLRAHCALAGLDCVSENGASPVRVEMVPESLKPVRAADSYSAFPGHPSRGGVFYIYGEGRLGQTGRHIHPVYRMTVAHETYPGHHLLDTCRWNHPDAVRRPVEYPLFYEGWACFGEGLMLDTGAFDRPYDRLILARRRYRHAVRGRIDLLLHSGDLSLQEAARGLQEAGFEPFQALETARKYALRPAYQMCYTVGRRRFRRLLDSCGEDGPGPFSRTVLRQGEILFEDLENILREDRGLGMDTQTRRRGDTGKR